MSDTKKPEAGGDGKLENSGKEPSVRAGEGATGAAEETPSQRTAAGSSEPARAGSSEPAPDREDPKPPRFALTDTDAAARFAKWSARDPFPSIAPALLSSAEIEDYVSATGMMFPFAADNGKLKPASYEVNLLGRVVYWDGEGKKQDRVIAKDEEFILKSNSIAFAQVEPTFRLPDYIALRFNLKIRHVYRGILLGTGPLVDPGFQGSLFIPLHNLTNNDYTFKGGEGLIWMEVTKLAWAETSSAELPERVGTFRAFPPDKKNKPLDYYLKRASPYAPIRSSIPVEIYGSRTAAEKAEHSARRMKNIGYLGGFGAALGLLALAITVALAFVDFRNDVRTHEEQMRKEFEGLRQERDALRKELQELQTLRQQWTESLKESREPRTEPGATGDGSR